MQSRNNKRHALGADDAKVNKKSNGVTINKPSLGQRKLTKKGAVNKKLTVADDKLTNLLGNKRSRKTVSTDNLVNEKPKFYSQYIFFEKNKTNGIISRPYFKNYYNSLDSIGKKNLKTFLDGFNDKTIRSVSDIKSDSNGNKYLIVKYDYNGIKTTGYVWYMSGMSKLIQLASKFDFQLDLAEIVKQAYR